MRVWEPEQTLAAEIGGLERNIGRARVMRRLIPLGICLVLLWCRLLPAQGTSASVAPAVAPSDRDSAGVEEMQPPVYYVQDKDGNLVPMFGFQFEDFMRAFRQLQGLDRQEVPPRFVIEEMSAAGKVSGKTAELSIQLSIRPQEKGAVRVPLGLSAAIVKQIGAEEKPAEETAAEGGEQPTERQLLEHDPREGYVFWIDGDAGNLHKISLDVLVPLTTVGGETRLRLQSPRATKSELRLTVSRGKLRGQVTEGVILETNPAGDGKTTEFVARGLGGNFELSWHDADILTTRTPTVLTAEAQILARIDEHSVNTEATLEIRGHGSPFGRFRVKLPQGAELLSTSPPGHTVVEVSPSETASPKTGKKDIKTGGKQDAKTHVGEDATSQATGKSRVVEIRLQKKTLGPVKIRLATRQSHGQGNSGQLVELCGFEVIGAAREWGHIALAVADDIHVSWDQQYRVRQVEELPDALRHEDVVAGFAYSSQPCSLKAWIVPRKTRLSVEPEYVVFVDGKDLRLEATLRYMVRGKKVFLLEVDLGDWELDEVGPASAVAGDGLDVDKSHKLRIPLLRRLAGKFEITIKAHRVLPPDTKTLKVHLPSPLAASSSSAALVIQPADNVELIPNDEKSVELTRQQVTAAENMPAGYQQRPLFYRGEASKAVFVGERSIHARKVSVDVESRVNFQRRTCLVYQRFSYHIDYQPLRSLEIDVPRAATGNNDLQFEVDGNKVIAAALAAKPGRKVDPDSVPMAIPLPSPGQIGSVELVIRYPLRWQNELPPQASIVREIHLAMPRDGELVGNRLSATSLPPLKVGAHDETWAQESGPESSPAQSLALNLSTPKANHKVVMAVHCEQLSEQKSTVVTKAWIRTDLTGQSRQDWAAFEVLTSQSDLDVFLPEGVGHAQVEIILDGETVQPKEASKNHLRLSLPAGNRERYLLQLQYHCPGERPAKGRMDLDLPRVGEDVWNRRLYWELILPQDEHVIINPKGFVCEYTWGWNGFFWGQQPVCNRDYAADWLGVGRAARGDVELPGEGRRHGANRYVFSTLGEPRECEFRTIGRSWIVLLASLAALVAGLVLIYVPLGRHPLSLLAAGVGLVVVGLIFPASTLLTLQASALGIALALMAGLMERSLARRRRDTSILGPGLGSGSSILDKDSTQSQHILPSEPVDSTESGRQNVADGSTSGSQP